MIHDYIPFKSYHYSDCCQLWRVGVRFIRLRNGKLVHLQRVIEMFDEHWE